MLVTILSKPDGKCPMCDDAVTLCEDNEVEYIKKPVDKPELQDICKRSVTTYPQILVDGKHIGTNFELESFFEDEYDPLLYPNPNRFTVFPIKHHDLWELYKKAQMSNWTAEELDFSSDLDDWKKLSDNEKHFIKHILAFFASSDGIVFENVNANFANEVQVPEARSFYAYQEHNEMVHGETYSLLIDKYIDDPDEKQKLFRSIETIPCIQTKARWALKWFDQSLPFKQRLVAFACVEGIFFSGSFCAIFWLKKRGLMPALSFSNELISRDEGLHQDFAVTLFHKLKAFVSPDTITEIVKDAVTIEKQFINDALPCKLIGMDSEKMSEYIEYVADRLLKQLHVKPVWNTSNPFDFMENISLDGKTNFFEKRVGDYGKLTGESEIKFDDDF